MINVTVHDSIHEVDARNWNEIVGAGRYLQTHAWLAILENDGLVDCPPKYFVCRREDGQIVAHLAAYMIETSLLVFATGVVNSLVGVIRKIWPKFLLPRILECGSPAGIGNPLCLREGVGFDEIVEPLCRSLEAVAEKAKIRIIVLRDFLEGEVQALSSFEKRGFGRVPNLPTLDIAVRWKTFDEYLSAMRHPPRKRLRRHLRDAAASQLTTRIRTEFSDLADQLANHVMNMNDHAKEVTREVLGPKFYRNLSANPTNCRIVEVLKGEHLVAHMLVITDATTLRPLRFGREKAGVHDSAYFLAITRIVQLAIEERMDVIDCGITTAWAKTDFGAKMVPIWMLVRIRAPFGATILKILRTMNPVPDIIERKIFKDEIQS
jgi:predicted N-acyltransferase